MSGAQERDAYGKGFAALHSDLGLDADYFNTRGFADIRISRSTRIPWKQLPPPIADFLSYGYGEKPLEMSVAFFRKGPAHHMVIQVTDCSSGYYSRDLEIITTDGQFGGVDVKISLTAADIMGEPSHPELIALKKHVLSLYSDMDPSRVVRDAGLIRTVFVRLIK